MEKGDSLLGRKGIWFKIKKVPKSQRIPEPLIMYKARNFT